MLVHQLEQTYCLVQDVDGGGGWAENSLHLSFSFVLNLKHL